MGERERRERERPVRRDDASSGKAPPLTPDQQDALRKAEDQLDKIHKRIREQGKASAKAGKAETVSMREPSSRTRSPL